MQKLAENMPTFLTHAGGELRPHSPAVNDILLKLIQMIAPDRKDEFCSAKLNGGLIALY